MGCGVSSGAGNGDAVPADQGLTHGPYQYLAGELHLWKIPKNNIIFNLESRLQSVLLLLLLLN